MKRRDFYKGSLAALALLLLPGKYAWSKKVAIKIAKLTKLEKVDGWTIVKLKGKQIMLIRTDKEHVQALSPICTHEKCLVAYNPKNKKIECGCHRSSYDQKGKVLSGPAPGPLTQYPAKLVDGKIIISLKD